MLRLNVSDMKLHIKLHSTVKQSTVQEDYSEYYTQWNCIDECILKDCPEQWLKRVGKVFRF